MDWLTILLAMASWLLLIVFVLLIIRHYQSFLQPSIRGYAAVIVATVNAFSLGVIFANKNPQRLNEASGGFYFDL